MTKKRSPKTTTTPPSPKTTTVLVLDSLAQAIRSRSAEFADAIRAMRDTLPDTKRGRALRARCEKHLAVIEAAKNDVTIDYETFHRDYVIVPKPKP